jgi:hypothetical protein
MTDDEFRDTFHRFELRLERMDTKVDALEKSLADTRAELRAMREGLETRLNSKAGNWVVSLWGATLADPHYPIVPVVPMEPQWPKKGLLHL